MTAARRLAVTVATTALVLAVLVGGWELYRWLWINAGWTWPFVVDDSSMPHVHTIVQALFEQPTAGVGDIIIVQLFHAALFTAKEAAVGFALGASFGFALGVLMSQWRILQRGLLPLPLPEIPGWSARRRCRSSPSHRSSSSTSAACTSRPGSLSR